MIDNEAFRARRLMIGIAGATVAAVIVVAALGRVAGFANLSDALSNADPQWLALCAVGQLLVFTGYSGVLRRALDATGRPRVTPGASVRLALASFAATQLLSFGGAAGLVIVYQALRRSGRDRRDALVVLLGLNTSVYLVFGVIAWSAAVSAWFADQAPPAMTLPWLIGFPAIVAAGRWFTAPSRIQHWLAPTGRALGRALAAGVGAAAWARDCFDDRNGRLLVSWAACYWAGDLLSLWAALHAFGARPEPAAMVAAYTTGYLVQSLPIPLIATAGVDSATAFLLHVVGVPLDDALLGVVAHRVFAFWLPIAPGTWFALRLIRDRGPGDSPRSFNAAV